LSGASEIATLAGGLRAGAAQNDVAPLRGDAPAGHPEALAVAVDGGRIVAVGPEGSVRQQVAASGVDPETLDLLDLEGATLTPGLIDPHTHLLFAGSREREWELRRRGEGYLEILAAGGGILSTVERTRAATDDELLAHGRRWLSEMLGHGVTTVEAKSGYGLDTENELRLLRSIGMLDEEGPIELVPTFLGAHAVPTDAADPGAYVETVIEQQLPRVAEQGIARFCDVFCEQGIFDVDQSRRILQAGLAAGLRPRLHADQIRASGGAQLAAELRAASADHLGAIDDEGMAALAGAAREGHAVTATLLPASTLVLGVEWPAPARSLIERGIPVALGTDFNPGSAPTANLPLVLSLACLSLGLTPAEALVAVTVNAAFALGLEATHGSLEPGRQADLVAWHVPTHEQIPYWLGAALVRLVLKRGRLVYRDGIAARGAGLAGA
jgi:imidazolonepropionase